MKKKLLQTSFKGIALVLSVFALTFAACNIDGIGDGTSGDGASLQLSRSAGAAPTIYNNWYPIPDYDTEGGGGFVMSANGIYLAAHWNDGSISYSTEGESNWRVLDGTQTTFGTNYVKYIAYLTDTLGNSLFWAVGQAGTIATSPDGLNWTSVRQSVTTADIYSIAYGEIRGGGTYVFVTDVNDSATYRSQIVYSLNGASWVAAQNNPVSTLKIDSIVYTNGNFAVFANTGYISYTSDMARWATAFQVDTGKGVNSNHFKMAAVGNDLIVATSRYGYAYVSTSDLSELAWHWQDAYPSASYTTHVWLNCVVFDGTQFIMAGQNGAMAYTTDGAHVTVDPYFDDPARSWTKGAYAAGLFINGVAYNSGDHLYVASGGDSRSVGVYTDGFLPLRTK
jgi:hypothetical protein